MTTYNTLKHLLQKIQSWLLPYTCLLCGAHALMSRDLCADCSSDLLWIKHACPRCGVSQSSSLQCGECLQNPPPYQNTVALFHYEPPVDRLITTLKFQHQLIQAKLLGELLAERLTDFYATSAWPEMIIPVPLHQQRLRERGFNQAIELAKPIAKKFHIPLERKHIKRIRPTATQSLIPAKQRRRNVKNAFYINPIFKANHVAIIDDVVTTGHTVRELSQSLLCLGNIKIDIWCCARTTIRSNHHINKANTST